MDVLFIGGSKDGIKTEMQIHAYLEGVKLQVGFNLNEESEEYYEFDGNKTFNYQGVRGRQRAIPEPDEPEFIEEGKDIRLQQYPDDLPADGMETDVLRQG